MLEEVFAECVRKLEPGGRIAVNVANLGRKPYRSLSADVTAILQDRLRLLLRGEVIWVKARGASGSCAWGSFQRPANPVLRDLTERVIVASNGRFDRAIPARRRLAAGLPSQASISRDEFMEATTDVWEIGPESASRVGHPAPFPVELPARLIHLYTYVGDLVLDPFIGSGTTAVAAVRSGRHFAGYDTDPTYVRETKRRVDLERGRPKDRPNDESNPLAAGLREGRSARDLTRQALEVCGFTDIGQHVSFCAGIEVDFVARDPNGGIWHFEVAGGFTASRPGLTRNDTFWKAVGKATVLREMHPDIPVVLLTPQPPTPGSGAHAALKALVGPRRPVRDVIVLTVERDLARLRDLAAGV
jgi:DNA modification methylase